MNKEQLQEYLEDNYLNLDYDKLGLDDKQLGLIGDGLEILQSQCPCGINDVGICWDKIRFFLLIKLLVENDNPEKYFHTINY